MLCHVTRPTPSSKTRTRHGLLGAKQTCITRTITPKMCRATQFFRPLLQFTTAAHSCIRCVAPRTNAATEVDMMSHSDRSLTDFRAAFAPIYEHSPKPPLHCNQHLFTRYPNISPARRGLYCARAFGSGLVPARVKLP